MNTSHKQGNGDRLHVAGLAAIVGFLIFVLHAVSALPNWDCLKGEAGWERMLASSFFGTVAYLLTLTAFSTIRIGLAHVGMSAPTVLPTCMTIYVLSVLAIVACSKAETLLVKPPSYCTLTPHVIVAAVDGGDGGTTTELTVQPTGGPDHRVLINWLTMGANSVLMVIVLATQYILESYLRFVYEQLQPNNPKEFSHHVKAVKILLKLLFVEAMLMFAKTVIAKWFGLQTSAICILFFAQTVLAVFSSQLTLGSDDDES